MNLEMNKPTPPEQQVSREIFISIQPSSQDKSIFSHPQVARQYRNISLPKIANIMFFWFIQPPIC